MEKILNIIKKFILSIPFLLVCFSIKHVYADDLDFYINFRPVGTGLVFYNDSSSIPTNQLVNFDRLVYSTSFYNDNITYHNNTQNWRDFNVYIYYNKEQNFYIFLNYSINANSDTSNFSYNLTCNNDEVNLSHYEEGATSFNVYNRSFLFSDSSISDDNFYAFFGENAPKTTSTLGNYNYYTSSKGSTLSSNGYFDNGNNYICNNYKDLQLVFILHDDFYINNIKQNIYVEPTPDPEPETPTVPPYNFNDNKYYVPNYHDGQCVEVIDKDTIRVFDDEFTSFYTDYYINSNYISKTGQVDLDYEKNCSNLQFTDIRYYGNDLPQILFILCLILLFTIGFPYILYKRFRKR